VAGAGPRVSLGRCVGLRRPDPPPPRRGVPKEGPWPGLLCADAVCTAVTLAPAAAAQVATMAEPPREGGLKHCRSMGSLASIYPIDHGFQHRPPFLLPTADGPQADPRPGAPSRLVPLDRQCYQLQSHMAHRCGHQCFLDFTAPEWSPVVSGRTLGRPG